MDLSKGHKTVKDLRARGAFTVSMGTLPQLVACDYVGVVSGNDDPDKMEKSGLHEFKAENVNAPCFEEYPMTMECTLRAYDEENCYMYGKIVNVSVDESVLTDGKPDPAKLQPIAFDQVNSKYLVVKDVVGNAFADGFALQK